MAAILIWAVDGVLLARLAHGRQWGRKAQIVLVVMVVCGHSFFLRLDKGAAFEEALGMTPPTGITLLGAKAAYIGGPGDRVVLLHFIADQVTIEAIVKQPISLMPADLHKNLTEKELIDIVEYMTTLRK